MARKPKNPINGKLGSNLGNANRRNTVVQVGLVAVVVLFAVGLLGYIVFSNSGKRGAGADEGVRVASENLVTQKGSDEPKVLITFYEDFLCPACGHLEQRLGATVSRLVEIGAVAVDYHMLALPGLDSSAYDHYSSRAANAAYCVAEEDPDPDKAAFRRFHTALFSPELQPKEQLGASFPDDKKLIERARQAGVVGGVPNCINSGRYLKMVRGMAATAGIRGTPTVLINGEKYEPSTPEALVMRVREIAGDIPGLDRASPESAVPEHGIP